MRKGHRFALLLCFAVLLGAKTSGADKTQLSPAQNLVNQAGTIANKVALLRGLPLKRPIVRGVMTKPAIKARILKIMKQEYTPAELDAEALSMKRFGLLPESTDYVKMMVNLLTDQIAGFYDHREKKLYIAGWMQSGSEMVMAHEIDHALQDQHFDLKQFMNLDRREGDALSARQALIEGDGVALMLEYQLASVGQPPPWGNTMIMAVLRKSMSSGSNSMPGIPLSIREGLLFPYTAGLDFVAHFRKQHPWSKIDAIFAKPPLSTEQILHPQKYSQNEQPHKVKLVTPQTSVVGYTERVSNVQGELGLRLFLQSHGVSETKASIAAAGWGGDRMAVFAKKAHKGSSSRGTIGVSLTSWDSENDAMEYYEALEHALPHWSKSQKSLAPTWLQFNMGSDTIFAQRKASRVLLVIAPKTSRIQKLAEEIWSSWSIDGAPIGTSSGSPQ